MKTKLFLLVSLTLIILINPKKALGQILVNGGFENWAVDSTGYFNPVGWHTTNNLSSSPAILQAPGRTGNYSVKVISVPDGSGGYWTAQLTIIYYGSIKPLQLSGYYKGSVVPAGDGFGPTIVVYDSVFDALGIGASFITSGSNYLNWTPFSFTVNYTDTVTPPAQTTVFITLSTTSPDDYGYIDDLSMTYLTGIGEIETMQVLSSSLFKDSRTGNYFLKIDLIKPVEIEIHIYNEMGQRVFQKNCRLNNGHNELLIPTDDLNSGLYFCRVTGNHIEKTLKFLK